MNIAKLNKWGNSTGVILPKKLLEHVGLRTGDHVRISVNAANGTIELTRIPDESVSLGRS